MNTRILVAALSLVAAGGAFANEVSDYATPQAVSTLSRAEVVAQVAQARAAGQLSVGEADVRPVWNAASLKSRDDVRAEVAAARASGELQRLNAETHDFAARGSVPAKAHMAAASIATVTR